MESDIRNKELFENLIDSEKIKDHLHVLNIFDAEAAWTRAIREGRISAPPRHLIPWQKWAIAAAILIFGTIGLLYINERQSTSNDISAQRIITSHNPKYKNDVPPAVEGATLVLADGEEIALSTAISIEEDGTILNENRDKLVDQPEVETPKYHELIVPQTNYFSFQLSDGTKVWVNANSRLSFPSRFVGAERKVKLLEGEAYFEVAKRPDQPCIVETTKANVKVLGTHFNVKNYHGNFAATLAEGAVEVSHDNNTLQLKPMQKAYLRYENLVVDKADLTKELSWKNNVFYFKNDNLKNVMQQIEDWYGVKAKLDRKVTNAETFSGEIKRDVPITQMLDMLEFTSGLEFSLEGTDLYIKPKKNITN
jgi:hypothetical protein